MVLLVAVCLNCLIMARFRHITPYIVTSILFLIGCWESVPAIENAASANSGRTVAVVFWTAVAVLTTIGLGLFSVVGLKTGKRPRDLPRQVRVYGFISLAVFVVAAILFALFAWALVRSGNEYGSVRVHAGPVVRRP
jgi:heme/copper-type cytochrome/quinol oxidase subunit 2